MDVNKIKDSQPGYLEKAWNAFSFSVFSIGCLGLMTGLVLLALSALKVPMGIPSVVAAVLLVVAILVAMIRDHFEIIVKTDKFNVTERGAHFINPDCFGKDFATWLGEKLKAFEMKVEEPGQEDWGWYINVRGKRRTYFVGIGFASPLDPSKPKQGPAEWRVIIARRRSLLEKLTRANRLQAGEEFVNALFRILRGEQDIKVMEDNSSH